ncbi:MOSC domain-containing protein YiiM [Saonia flava]|uniref:MOSC domain-containing protein YiiM n=1 Tax=Saonia flava TaxID=523696 RepID=A0A846QZS1_9FLAO|nr:MOSC domain-containing protein [Saonia flava]NJB70624.1 MOSC domain-containing protein YiiM [Saonia flava]
MKIVSTNIGEPTTFTWNGKEEKTGIFKYPINVPLYLTKNDVKNDTIIDRVHHGGENKACYLFSTNFYPYWKRKYPHLDWNWGMFGENLTIEGLDESVISVGDIYKLGTALVQISQPREPCYKLGVRFGHQKILKEFIDHGHPGTYVKILEEGVVKTGDSMVLIEQNQNRLTIQQLYRVILQKEKDMKILKMAIENMAVPVYKRERLQKYIT